MAREVWAPEKRDPSAHVRERARLKKREGESARKGNCPYRGGGPQMREWRSGSAGLREFGEAEACRKSGRVFCAGWRGMEGGSGIGGGSAV